MSDSDKSKKILEQEEGSGETGKPIPKVKEISSEKLTIQSGEFGRLVQKQVDLIFEKTKHPEKRGVVRISDVVSLLENEPINPSFRVFHAILHSNVTGDRIVAVKLTPADRKHQREAKIHFSVPHHKNIVERIITDIFHFRGQASIYIVMEYCDCNLYDHIRSQVKDGVPFDAQKYLSISYQIVVGLDFLHSHYVVHGDLKPSNVLLILEKNIVKLCDFGLSRAVMDDVTQVTASQGCSTGWMAPEVLIGTTKLGFKSDIFPLGLVTFYSWSYGKHPYGDESFAWNHYIVNGENRNLDGMLIPDVNAAKVLLESLLKQNQTDRPTAEEVLKHPIFASQEKILEQEEGSGETGKPIPKVKEISSEKPTTRVGGLRRFFQKQVDFVTGKTKHPEKRADQLQTKGRDVFDEQQPHSSSRSHQIYGHTTDSGHGNTDQLQTKGRDVFDEQQSHSSSRSHQIYGHTTDSGHGNSLSFRGDKSSVEVQHLANQGGQDIPKQVIEYSDAETQTRRPGMTDAEIQTRPLLEPGTFQISSTLSVLEKEPIGIFSMVFCATLCSDITGNKKVVVKITPADEKYQQEARIFFLVPRHQNIVERIATDVFDFRGVPSIYIAMELCDCNLYDHIKSQLRDGVPFDAQKYLSFTHQIVVALNFLHSLNVVHGNLKPSNVLLILSQNVIKLSDFGLSTVASDEKTLAQLTVSEGGTTGWKAPEVLEGTIAITSETDIFPLGLICHFVWSYGRHPYGDEFFNWNHYIIEGTNLNLERMLIPDADSAKAVLQSMLQRNPKNRPTAEEVQRHQIFSFYEVASATASASHEHCSATINLQSSDGDSKFTLQRGKYGHLIQRQARKKTGYSTKPGIGFRISSFITVLESEPISLRSRVFHAILHNDVTGDKKIVAKITPPDRYHQQEAKFHSLIPQHKNIVERIAADVFNFKGQPSIYMALGYCDCDLRDHIKSQVKNRIPFDAQKYLLIGRQVVVAVEFLHSHNIVHGDLKPSNVLLVLNENLVKLCDFGLSRMLKGDADLGEFAVQQGGTYGWMAPEVLAGTAAIGLETDIFPLGLVCHYAWSYGKHPYGDKPDTCNYYILEGTNPNLDKIQIPNGDFAKSILESMLQHNPADRPTAKKVLEHQMFGSRVSIHPTQMDDAEVTEVAAKAFRVMSGAGENGDENEVAALTIGQLSNAMEKILRRNNREVVEMLAGSEYTLDEPLRKALEGEFKKLSSNRPEEFEKILLALDQYGVYDLDDLKKMPEEDVETLDIKLFQRRYLMQYIKKLNGGREFSLAASLERKIKTAASKDQSIGPDGGCVENFGCKITFPPKAVEKETKIKTSVITDFSDSPQGKKPIAPILECKHVGNFNIPVQIEMHSWARPNHLGVQGRLYRKDEETEWKFIEYVALDSEGKISFTTLHFTRFGVFMDATIGLISSALSSVRAMVTPGKLESVKQSTQSFLHCCSDGAVAVICCLNDSKIIEGVKSSVREYNYIHPLLLLQPQMVPHDGKLSVGISCHCPDNLKILVDDNTLEQKCERSLDISDLLESTYQLEYFHLRIGTESGSENLTRYKGEIQMSFSITNGKPRKYLIAKEWPLPIPKKDPITIVNKKEVTAINHVESGGKFYEIADGGNREVHVEK